MPTLPADRNLQGELGHVGVSGINAGINQLIGGNYDNLRQFGGAYTDLNLGNYGRALLGDGADTSGGVAALARQGWAAANPELAGYTGGLSSLRDRLGAGGAPQVSPLGYAQRDIDAASAGPAAAANWTGARARYAEGGPLLGTLEHTAAAGLGPTAIEQGLQGQALGLLGAGGGLTPGELAGAQDNARAAYADRGLLRSNRGVGAEILSTDAVRRSRMFENAQFAQGVGSMLEQAQNARRNYALGVQGQGQQLSQYNAGLGTGISTFNAGQRNQLSQFNAGLANQQGQYNAGLLQQARLANQAAYNRGQEFNAGVVNDASRFNAGLTLQDRNDQWSRAMGLGQFQQQQAINPFALASQLQGAPPDYTAGVMGYGNDVYNTNYNSHMARYIGSKNNSAGLASGIIGAVGTVGGAIVGGPMGAAIGGAIGRGIGGAVSGGGSSYGDMASYMNNFYGGKG